MSHTPPDDRAEPAPGDPADPTDSTHAAAPADRVDPADAAAPADPDRTEPLSAADLDDPAPMPPERPARPNGNGRNHQPRTKGPVVLRRQQILPTTAHQIIGARNATTKEAAILEDRRGAALLTATRTTYDQNGRVIEYGTHIYRAAGYSFETTLFSA